ATALAGTIAAPDARAARAFQRPDQESWIELFNTHTNETVSVAFATSSGFVASALAKLNYLLRDHRANEQHPIDPALFAQLGDLAFAAGRDARYEVISGYRSPQTNAHLRANGRGVAKRSLQMEGRAIDVRLKNCPCSRLRDLALEMQRGGVGYYARSNFVHLDTGRV